TVAERACRGADAWIRALCVRHSGVLIGPLPIGMPAPGTSKGEKMDFGTFHLFETIDSSETAAVHDQIDLMIAAESLGFSSVWAAETHSSEYGVCPSPILALAAVARQTKTLRLGTGIVVLPFHDPLRVAEELA